MFAFLLSPTIFKWNPNRAKWILLNIWHGVKWKCLCVFISKINVAKKITFKFHRLNLIDDDSQPYQQFVVLTNETSCMWHITQLYLKLIQDTYTSSDNIYRKNYIYISGPVTNDCFSS